MLLGGKELAFYEYKDDVNTLLDKVRTSLNRLAEGWSSTQKEHCLQETADAFKVRLGLGKAAWRVHTHTHKHTQHLHNGFMHI